MAPNPKQGAAFSLYLKEVPKSSEALRKAAEKKAQKNNQTISYPPLDSLRAENNEEKNYLLFIIKNSQGEEIRRFTTAMQAGLNRYYWDGRTSNRTYLNESNEPLTNAGTANFVAPGKYSVEILKSINGQLYPLTDSPQDFNLNWLNNNSFRAENAEALAAFQAEIESTRRNFAGLKALHKKLEERSQKLKALARNTPGSPLTILNDLKKIEKQLRDLDLALNGDNIRAKYYFETAPSLSDRINSAVWNSYSTTSGPTGEQKKNLQIVSKASNQLKMELNALQKELDTFYSILLNNGAPYLEGDLD
jgi:hypothetical protein